MTKHNVVRQSDIASWYLHRQKKNKHRSGELTNNSYGKVAEFTSGQTTVSPSAAVGWLYCLVHKHGWTFWAPECLWDTGITINER